jgi:hypothetical protein
MNLILRFVVAAVIAAIHFGVGFFTSIYAAGQADSLGQPHGYGWIISADIFVFPLSLIPDSLWGSLHLPDAIVLCAMLTQSAGWGLVISLLFPWQRKDHCGTDAA